MADLRTLGDKIKSSGITFTALSEKCGISRETLYNRMAGKSEFKASEIYNITTALHLSRADRDKIFFGTMRE